MTLTLEAKKYSDVIKIIGRTKDNVSKNKVAIVLLIFHADHNSS